MYLSKLVLRPSRRTYMWLSRPYRVHQRLRMATPQEPRLLYRLEGEQLGRGDAAVILAQSHAEPDWDAAFADFPVLAQSALCKPVEWSLHAGQMLAFRLRANPTQRMCRDEKGEKLDKGKRVGIYKEEAQRAWLRRKAENGGFLVVHSWLHKDEPFKDRIEREGEVHQLKLAAVQFEGLLQVTDPDRLRQTLTNGIGSGKGLGFGLLSVGPARG